MKIRIQIRVQDEIILDLFHTPKILQIYTKQSKPISENRFAGIFPFP